MVEGIRLYNLYPKLVGEMPKWKSHIERASAMNFDWIYINPIHSSGFSGSDYAVKDYYLYNPLFIKGWPLSGDDYKDENLKKDRKSGDEMLEDICAFAQKRGMNIMMDLVINHTAVDSPLTQLKPSWYKRDKNGKIMNPGADNDGQWVTWGDLAQIDNEDSEDRDELWNYWLAVINHYCELGIRGFRCDAAYHVPKELWIFLIGKIKEKYEDVIFLGETLGCTPKELQVVAEAGFDIVMNSFKWWNYKEDWFLKDYKEWAGLYPSLTFPENHDTERFAKENNGNRELAVATYALQAYFCSSVAVTLGFEYGFENKIDVVSTNPSSYENIKYDISDELARINLAKSHLKILREDNIIKIYPFENQDIFAFTKESLDKKERIFVVFNLSRENWNNIYVKNIYELLGNTEIKDLSFGHQMEEVPYNLEYNLKPLEIKLFYALVK